MESARKNDTCAYGKKNQIGWIAPYTLAQISGEIFFWSLMEKAQIWTLGILWNVPVFLFHSEHFQLAI